MSGRHKSTATEQAAACGSNECQTKRMRNECDYSKPEDVVSVFIKEMAQWEFEATKQSQAAEKTDDPTAFWAVIKESCQEIFDYYCTPKKRPYGRQGGTFSHRDNGDEYVEILEVIQESSRRCAVTVEQSFSYTYKAKEWKMTGKFRYVLIKKGGKWLIDSRKKYSGTDKLINYFL